MLHGFSSDDEITNREIGMKTARGTDTYDKGGSGEVVDQILRLHGKLRLAVAALSQRKAPLREIGTRQLQIRENCSRQPFFASPQPDRPLFGERGKDKDARRD